MRVCRFLGATENGLTRQNDPQRVNDAGDETEQRQHNAQPKMQTQPDLQKHTDGWQQNGEQDANDVASGGMDSRRHSNILRLKLKHKIE